MWYIVAAGVFLWNYLRNDLPPVHRWLHQPVLGTHAADTHGLWLAGIVVMTLVICAVLTARTGEMVPGVQNGGGSIAMGVSFAFVGFLWYLVQIHAKPAQNIIRPQPTVTVTANPSHPVTTVVHTIGVNWQTVSIGALIVVAVLAVLYFIVRYVL